MLEKKEGNKKCESGESCQSDMWMGEKKKKSCFQAFVKCLLFPSKYQIYGLHGGVLWALLDMNNFRLEYHFSSDKHLVQGQALALESHIAVSKSCC